MKAYISEIFESIDGEVTKRHQGHTTIFIRFAGCNLRCSYCDTMYSHNMIKHGQPMYVTQVVKLLARSKVRHVTITGGEPLTQPDAFKALVHELWSLGYSISVETNGSLPLLSPQLVDCWVVDYKLPSSGMFLFNDKSIFYKLTLNDFVKFVIQTDEDFIVAVNTMNEIRKFTDVPFAMSPVMGNDQFITPQRLIKEVLTYGLDVIVNVQLHKLLRLNEAVDPLFKHKPTNG